MSARWANFFTRSPAHEWFSKRWSLRRADRLKRQNRTGTRRSENRQNRHGRRSTVNLRLPSDRQVTAKEPPNLLKHLVLQGFAAVDPCGTFGCRMELICNEDVASTRGVPQNRAIFETRQNHSGVGEARSTCATHLTPQAQLEMALEKWNRPWPQKKKTEQKLNQKWWVSKTAFIKTAFRSFRLEDRNLRKLRSLDSSCPFFLSDNRIWGQWTQVLQMLWSQGQNKTAFRTSKCCINR